MQVMLDIILLCALAAAGANCASVNINSTNDVTMEATPPEIHEGFTSHMTLTCNFSHHDLDSDFSTVMSLLVSKASISEESVYTEIAAISAARPDTVVVKDSLGAINVTGHLTSLGGDSFITFSWRYPSSDVIGSYKCDAFGMDMIGHPRVSSTEVEVGESLVDMDTVLHKMKEMDLTLQAQLDAQKATIDAQKHQLDSQKAQIETLKQQWNSAWGTTFQANSSYQGHTYYLTKDVIMADITVAEGVCESYGGYLVEIDDQPEFDFVVAFLNANNATNHVYIGATDTESESKFVFLHSEKPMSFANWGPGQPNKSTNENCIQLMYPPAWAMHDYPCAHQSGYISKYVCEIP